MPSDFFGLQVGLSALNAARRQMEVAAQNVSNANTEGYSRQRVEIATVGNPTVAAVHARSDGAGSGVAVVGTFRTIDEFLQARSLTEHSTNSQLGRTKTLLSRMELAFKEPSDTGIQAQLADFWSGFEDVANSPGNLASRSQLIQRASTLATSINQAANDMTDLWKTSVEQLQTVLTGVNATADSVAQLNGSIKRATAAGLNPNALMDQRDRLVQTLAEQIGGVVKTGVLGQVDVYVGGTAIVRGEDSEHLVVDTNGSNIVNAYDQPSTPGLDPLPVLVRWQKDNFPATVTGGEAAALLDGVNRMLPAYRAALIGPGPTPATAVATVPPAPLQFNFATTNHSFDLAVNGAAAVTVTLNTDLSGGPLTPSALQNALNAALGQAGLTGVAAKVRQNGANFDVSLQTVDSGASKSLVVGPTGADTLFGNLFGVGPTVTNGTDSSTGIVSLASQISNTVNALHLQGVDLNGNAGKELFTFDPVNGLSVNITDPKEVAAGGAGKPALDGANALSLADVSNTSNGPDNTYRSLIITLGVETQTVNRRVDIQSDITKQVDAAKDSASGVSIDEEMANMIAFQHTYGAASRVITAIDQMLERLINGTGLVGR
ncbi:MAG: flagellar hook-associated protein FlgK [Actinomycetia bacterium]|nr:flagellar hook-associated protein FlgK [Actinomycetes bacterium]